MALTPFYEVQDIEQQTTPTKTWVIDWQNGTIGNAIDDVEALMQALKKIVMTTRFQYVLYSDNYGCEIESLIGTSHSKEYYTLEIERMLKDAFLNDDRVTEVLIKDLIINSDNFTANVELNTIYGPTEMEVAG